LSVLPPQAQVVFALACAARLVRASGAASQRDMDEALAVGWSVALGGAGDCQAVCSTLEPRDDLDNDEVAAVAYALGAVIGESEDAWAVASRAIDAAFERVEYPAGASTFRPLARTWPRSPSRPKCVGSTKHWKGLPGTERLPRSLPGLGDDVSGRRSCRGSVALAGRPPGEETDRVINSRSGSSAPAGYRFRVRRLPPFAADCHHREGTRAR
jgi:hypothetical protein